MEKSQSQACRERDKDTYKVNAVDHCWSVSGWLQWLSGVAFQKEVRGRGCDLRRSCKHPVLESRLIGWLSRQS